jgi:phytoene synthase
MVSVTSFDPETELALSYAPDRSRAGVAALFALDLTLGDLLRSTTEPLLGQMRLTWWFEALEGLDRAPAPGEPVLQALEADVMTHGITGARLATLIDGWDVLLEEPIDETAIARHGESRGAGLFTIAGEILGCVDDPVAAAGAGWALADLSMHLSNQGTAGIARSLALTHLKVANAARWSREGRALGALERLAAIDLAQPAEARRVASPRRVARMAWHRLTGR